MKTENTTYEDMKEAFTEHTGVVLDADPADDVPLEGVKIVSQRTESGKRVDPEPEVVAEVVKEPEPVVEAGVPVEVEMKWDHTRPPSSWTPKAREEWGKLSETIQREITRREENSFNGARNIREKYEPMSEFVEALRSDVLEAMQQGGVEKPALHIRALMNVERTLRTAPMPEKFNTLMAMADQFGIPLRQIVNQSVGQEVLRAPQQPQQAEMPAEFQRELTAMREWREEQEQHYISAEVEQVGANLEFFQDVRHIMADLVERGIADGIEDAYEKAVWLSPEVREVLVGRTAPQAVNPVTTRQAKAVGASIKPSGAIDVDIEDGSEDSITDTLRKAFNAQQGRI